MQILHWASSCRSRNFWNGKLSLASPKFTNQGRWLSPEPHNAASKKRKTSRQLKQCLCSVNMLHTKGDPCSASRLLPAHPLVPPALGAYKGKVKTAMAEGRDYLKGLCLSVCLTRQWINQMWTSYFVLFLDSWFIFMKLTYWSQLRKSWPGATSSLASPMSGRLQHPLKHAHAVPLTLVL